MKVLFADTRVDIDEDDFDDLIKEVCNYNHIQALLVFMADKRWDSPSHNKHALQVAASCAAYDVARVLLLDPHTNPGSGIGQACSTNDQERSNHFFHTKIATRQPYKRLCI